MEDQQEQDQQEQDQQEQDQQEQDQQEPILTDEEKVAAVKAESAELLAEIQRISAAYLNLQQATKTEIARIQKEANQELIAALAPALEQLGALASGEGDEALLRGAQLVLDKATEIKTQYDIKQDNQ